MLFLTDEFLRFMRIQVPLGGNFVFKFRIVGSLSATVIFIYNAKFPEVIYITCHSSVSLLVVFISSLLIISLPVWNNRFERLL